MEHYAATSTAWQFTIWRLKNMDHKKYCVVSGTLFALVALAHLLRIVADMPVQVDDFAIPMWVSWIATIVPAGLAFWAFRIARQPG